MPSSDKALNRLVLILSMLSEDKRPTVSELASEFNVSERTIQRDIYERLHMYPIEKRENGTLCFLEGFEFGKSTLNHEEMVFFQLASSLVKDIDDTFDSISKKLYKKLLTPTCSSSYFIKPDLYEPLEDMSKVISPIEDAIEQDRLISFDYFSVGKTVEPYKIVNFDGIWYLFAKEIKDRKIKTFMLSNIKTIHVLHANFTKPQDIDKVLENVHSAWFEDGNSFIVEVKISAKIAKYFTLKKHLSSQKTVKELSNGALIVSFEISHEEDLDNLIKSWLPHIKVLKPKSFQEKIEKELQAYLKYHAIDI